MVATGNSYTEACRSFSVSVKELSSHFQDSDVITVSSTCWRGREGGREGGKERDGKEGGREGGGGMREGEGGGREGRGRTWRNEGKEGKGRREGGRERPNDVSSKDIFLSTLPVTVG